MIDIKVIRDNPRALDAALKKRGLAPLSSKIIELDTKKREGQTALQALQAQRNEVAKKMGMAAKNGQDPKELAALGAGLKAQVQGMEDEIRSLEAAVQDQLARLPNLPHESVPLGTSEAQNLELLKWGAPRPFDFKPKEHYELGEALGLMDFDAAAQLSGARFVVLRGDLARLERALAAFMLDIHTKEFGYEEHYLPLLVTSDTMFGTGQLPKFEEDFFRTTSGHWLIPTAEAPLTNLGREKVLEEAALPLRVTAYTPCFRSEAGSAGRDTRGMLRQHQFGKVELVSLVAPADSEVELERMTEAAQTVLQRLGLPYRLMLLCTGDMGICAAKTYDLEVWLPGQDCYREISSCSNCLDYQARRMNARYRPKGSEGPTGKQAKPVFLHTLNGSGVAVGRALIAVLENYQQSDGSIIIPPALRPYMGGQEKIVKERAYDLHN